MTQLFTRICGQLSLGALLDAPVRLHGGYTHRMYALRAEGGRYAVKLLNPEIMRRETALGSYRRAEEMEALLEARGLPILPALTIHGQKLQCVDGQYLYVFDYFDGKPLTDGTITPAHCMQMGAVLAKIHAIDRRELPGEPEASEPIDWDALADDLLADGEAHADGLLMKEAIPLLTRVTAAAEEANLRLPRIQTICHNDMDAKNVLWQGDAFRIIDLECLGWADPLQEMLDLAISWGGYPLDEARFKAFVQAYYAAGGERPGDAALLIDSRRNHIDWLAYNAVRALGSDPQERATGRSQIGETIEKIRYDQRNRAAVLRWLEEV